MGRLESVCARFTPFDWLAFVHRDRRSRLCFMADSSTTIAELRQIVRQFVDARDWRQFHSPKNLSMSLAIEAAELMEHFQWIETAESRLVGNDPAKLREGRDELADVLCYVLAIDNEMGNDLCDAMMHKIIKR